LVVILLATTVAQAVVGAAKDFEHFAAEVVVVTP